MHELLESSLSEPILAGAQIFISVAINYSIVELSSLLALKSQCVGPVWTVVISLCVGLSDCFIGPLNDVTFCRKPQARPGGTCP